MVSRSGCTDRQGSLKIIKSMLVRLAGLPIVGRGSRTDFLSRIATREKNVRENCSCGPFRQSLWAFSLQRSVREPTDVVGAQ